MLLIAAIMLLVAASAWRKLAVCIEADKSNGGANIFAGKLAWAASASMLALGSLGVGILIAAAIAFGI